MASKLSWFATKNGRQFAFYGTFSAGIGFFLSKYLPHTFFLDKYQNVVQMYRHGTDVPVPVKIINRVEQVLEDMKVPPKERKLLKIFTVIGFDMFHAGSTWAKTGCLIGIPKNFTYDSREDVDKAEILVSQKSVPWHSPEGEALEKAIVLSPEAQKYAIAYQVSLCQTPYIFFLSLYPMLSTIFAHSIASTLNDRFQLHARKMIVRGTMYSIVGLFSFGLWALATDLTTMKYERKADLKACSLGPEYVRGGVEFYNKILARNITLRKLMGPEGEKVFTAYGNDQVLLRMKHVPITERRTLLEKKIIETMGWTGNEHESNVI